MTDGRKTVVLAIAMTISLTAISLTTVAEAPRAGEPLPSWDLGNVWLYRTDYEDLEEYTAFGVIYQDAPDPRIVADIIMTPTEASANNRYTLTSDTVFLEMTRNNEYWENGTWGSEVSESEDPATPVGTVMDSGIYTIHTECTGKSRYRPENLNYISGTMDCTDYYDADDTDGNGRDLSWTLEVETDQVSTTMEPTAIWKPTWDTAPMEVGDSWSQDTSETTASTQNFEFGGHITGSGSSSWTTTYSWDFQWTVESKASKTIKKGPNQTKDCTFQEAYRLARTGEYTWYVDDGTNPHGGTTTTGEYEKWYGSDGDLFDAGWAIEYNMSARLISSNYESFINSPPEVTKEPEDGVTATEDQIWEFVNGLDYTVSDPDPGEAGQLTYEIDAVLGSNTNVLTDLTIDASSGNIEFTPTQADVATGYTVTITATDRYKDPLSVAVVFTLDIINSNDAPGKNAGTMASVKMDEGDTTSPSWDLSDVFYDPDMDPNPLMSNEPYDADEALSYSYTFTVPGDEGAIIVKCPNGDPLGASNQCAVISFEAVDGSFPTDRSVPMTFTATDNGGMKASEQMDVEVRHTNHPPGVPDGAEDEFEMDEDLIETLELKDYFFDFDVDNNNYRNTGDKLAFDKDGEENIKITITGSRAKLEPDANWNGEEEVTFEATDTSGKSVTHDLTIIVNPVNDLPEVASVDPDTAPVLDETEDGGEDGDLTQQDLKIVATDVDKDSLSFNWTVTEDESGEIFMVDTHTDTYTFETVFKGDFEEGEFDGGDGSRTYTVTAYVTDGKAEVKTKEWYVTVKNVNRRPNLDGVDIYELKKDGSGIGIAEKTPDNFTLKYGKVYRFDATKRVKDEDERDILDLHYDWSSHRDGPLGSDISIDVGAGKGSTMASAKLKPGRHIITLRVSDDDGASAEYAFTVDVGDVRNDTTIIPTLGPMAVVGAIGLMALALFWRRRSS